MADGDGGEEEVGAPASGERRLDPAEVMVYLNVLARF
jgi:hypothetical protein